MNSYLRESRSLLMPSSSLMRNDKGKRILRISQLVENHIIKKGALKVV